MESKMPKCTGEIEIYTRVVGFFRPTKLFNKGKKEEYKDRKEYNVTNSMFKQKERENEKTNITDSMLQPV